MGLAIGLAAGFGLLGGLSLLYLWKRYRFPFPLALRSLTVSVVFALISWIVTQRMSGVSLMLQLLVAVPVVGGMSATYLLLLWRWKAPWIRNAQRRLFVP